MRRASDASKIAPRDRYRYPTEYRALKTRCRGRPSEAKCTPHRDDPKITNADDHTMPDPVNAARPRAWECEQNGKDSAHNNLLSESERRDPKNKNKPRVPRRPQRKREASCCLETTDMPDTPLVTLGCINYRDTGRPSAHGSEAQTHLLQIARHQDDPRRQYARP